MAGILALNTLRQGCYIGYYKMSKGVIKKPCHRIIA